MSGARCLLFAVVAVVWSASHAFGQPSLDPTDLDADGLPGVAGPLAGCQTTIRWACGNYAWTRL